MCPLSPKKYIESPFMQEFYNSVRSSPSSEEPGTFGFSNHSAEGPNEFVHL